MRIRSARKYSRAPVSGRQLQKEYPGVSLCLLRRAKALGGLFSRRGLSMPRWPRCRRHTSGEGPARLLLAGPPGRRPARRRGPPGCRRSDRRVPGIRHDASCPRDRASPDRRPDSRQLDAIRGAERSLDEGCRVRTVFDEYRQRFDGKTGLRQRFEPSLRPRQILKHADRESLDVGPHHGGNVSR